MKKILKRLKTPKNLTKLFIFGAFALIILLLTSVNLYKSMQATHPASTNSSVQNQPGLYTWGSNASGQLGVDFARSFNPLKVDLQDIKEVAAGYNHSAALTKNNQLVIWGSNRYGQLGYNTDLSYSASPTFLTELFQVKKVATNHDHTLALKEDGTVWAFGSNFTGQLGDGTNISNKTPKKVANLEGVKDIATGYKFSLAIKEDNTLWAWGTSCDFSDKARATQLLQSYAQNITALQGGYYDTGSTQSVGHDQVEDCLNEDIIGINSKVPVKIEKLSNVKSVSGGYGHVLALLSDGSIWSFGCNKYGQLGQGDIKNVIINSTPRKIAGLPEITAASAGYRHSLAVTKNGEVYAWGHNDFGELGTKTTTSTSIPVKIPGLTNVKEVIAGFDYSLAIKKDGTVWGWGINNFRQLGNDEIQKIIMTPTQIKTITHVSQISAGGGHVLALVK